MASSDTINHYDVCWPNGRIAASILITNLFLLMCVIRGFASAGKTFIVLWGLCIILLLMVGLNILAQADSNLYDISEGILTMISPRTVQEIDQVRGQ